MKTKLPLLSLIAAATLSACSSTDNALYFERAQLEQDISYLASDDLKGRKTFSAEIDVAADYIAQRFTSIGLQPMPGAEGFKQQFDLHSVTPKSVSVSLNNQAVTTESLAVVSQSDGFAWQQADELVITQISADADLREQLRKLNQQGGNHLVLVDKAHEELFTRYQNYFNNGLTKLELKDQGAMVLVLGYEGEVKDLDVKVVNEVKTQQLTNVIGILPGKKEDADVVLFSAHYDHLGESKKDQHGHQQEEGEEQDSIYNGANDNASGTGAMLNLAQHYARHGDNERTLMFAAFTAEEMGLIGSKHFATTQNPDAIAAMINIEMIGKPSPFGSGNLWMTGADKSDLQAVLNQSLPLENHIQANPYPKLNLFYRSDNASLAGMGVPAHSFSSTDMANNDHYHTPKDELANLDFESIYKSVTLLAMASEPLVSAKATPSRVAPLKDNAEGKIY
ncbi:M20/M25/M40 family metallo-hydrolase [Pseudoalteromonas sp. BDTF-M6]|uniref:M28 family metallopeptidase n=1 Tax=Pseudoalteromonas sp. BDTF-M6 TaxID=2796132 RepID=UPI001BAF5E44|nr:M20/M25/M40 family metallo-hydrolase [Pseudoalteromonas sp. BDTF-M6]MBS3799048.1 M20/M25/M40 family metallo-hydrolase [Pseudoalteromonas sp. BDTF-M6]